MLYKPNPDKPMHQMTLPTIDGKGLVVSGSNNRWQMMVVYRGLHCPICKTYTAKIEALKDKFDELETDVVFISGDTAEKAKNFASEVGLNLPVAYDLAIEHMRQLGLYISEPRLFVFNEKGQPHIVEISNAPFIRPEPELIIRGIMHIKKNNYPIRGTLP